MHETILTFTHTKVNGNKKVRRSKKKLQDFLKKCKKLFLKNCILAAAGAVPQD